MVAIVAPAAPADDVLESRKACPPRPHPSREWSQKTLLPIVECDGFYGVVLPVAAATAVLCQCSRPSLGPAAAYWTPTTPDIAQLEARLTAYLRPNAHPHLRDQWRRLGDYLRQYLGVERGGRKLIYVNFLGGELFSFVRRPTHRAAIERRWRSTAFVICDGGPDFFSVEYDVAAAQFTRIDFNY